MACMKMAWLANLAAVRGFVSLLNKHGQALASRRCLSQVQAFHTQHHHRSHPDPIERIGTSVFCYSPSAQLVNACNAGSVRDCAWLTRADRSYVIVFDWYVRRASTVLLHASTYRT